MLPILTQHNWLPLANGFRFLRVICPNTGQALVLELRHVCLPFHTHVVCNMSPITQSKACNLVYTWHYIYMCVVYYSL